MATNHTSTIVKLADRIANVRAAVSERKHKLYHMYRKEMKDFSEQMPRMAVAEPMWQELEQLFAPGQIL